VWIQYSFYRPGRAWNAWRGLAGAEKCDLSAGVFRLRDVRRIGWRGSESEMVLEMLRKEDDNVRGCWHYAFLVCIGSVFGADRSVGHSWQRRSLGWLGGSSFRRPVEHCGRKWSWPFPRFLQTRGNVNDFPRVKMIKLRKNIFKDKCIKSPKIYYKSSIKS